MTLAEPPQTELGCAPPSAASTSSAASTTTPSRRSPALCRREGQSLAAWDADRGLDTPGRPAEPGRRRPARRRPGPGLRRPGRARAYVARFHADLWDRLGDGATVAAALPGSPAALPRPDAKYQRLWGPGLGRCRPVRARLKARYVLIGGHPCQDPAVR